MAGTKKNKNQKRIKLIHGTARVDENISQDTIDALNRMVQLAYQSTKEKKPKSANQIYNDAIREPLCVDCMEYKSNCRCYNWPNKRTDLT